MRQLLPSYDPDVDLREAYRYPTDRPWVRANMVSSLDGSAVQDGRSGGLSGEADKAVFGVLRGLADVVLVGAGTAAAEGYRAPKAKASYADLRASLGQRPAPVLDGRGGRDRRRYGRHIHQPGNHHRGRPVWPLHPEGGQLT